MLFAKLRELIWGLSPTEQRLRIREMLQRNLDYLPPQSFIPHVH